MNSTELLRQAGATERDAQTICESLAQAGLSSREIAVWLSGRDKAHPVRVGSIRAGHVEVPAEWGPLAAVSEGHADAVVAEARAFADLTSDERLISRMLLLPAAETRRLTSGDAARAHAAAEVLRYLKARLNKDGHVYDVVYAFPSVSNRVRLIDRLAAGEADAVLEELRVGALDPSHLRDEGIAATYDF